MLIKFNRFLISCEAFGKNENSVKLATAFLLSRLLKVHDEESWSKFTFSNVSGNK